MATPLHPNLAKLAASYDEILERYSRGSLSAAQARGEISTLVARDDEGILWSIDPDDGQWMRRTHAGDLVPGTPPTYGLATPTPHELSTPPSGFDPANRIESHVVHDELLHSPSAYAGSTRAVRTPVAEPRESGLMNTIANLDLTKAWRYLIIVAVGALLVVAGLWIAHDIKHKDTTPTTTTTTHVVMDAPIISPGAVA